MTETRDRTRVPMIFGGCLMLAGSGLYFIDMMDAGRNTHWFVFPAMLLMGLGALFATIGQRQPALRVRTASRARTTYLNPFASTVPGAKLS